MKEAKIEFIDDGPGKPVGINRSICRRPIFWPSAIPTAMQMVRYVSARPGASLALYLHHDDAEREYAYDRQSTFGRFDTGLDEAAAKVWPVVSMKTDWKEIFPEPK